MVAYAEIAGTVDLAKSFPSMSGDAGEVAAVIRAAMVAANKSPSSTQKLLEGSQHWVNTLLHANHRSALEFSIS